MYDADIVRRGLDALEAMWLENNAPENDPKLSILVARLHGQSVDRLATGKTMSALEKLMRMLTLIRATGISFGRSARKHVPTGAVYVNVGQIMLALPFFMHWLRKRPDVVPVFMLHDVIPLEMPNHVDPSSVKHHAQMVKTAATYASALIVTTEHVKKMVGAAIARHRRTPLPTLAQALPVSDVFNSPPSESRLTDVPYFVVCGSIEPRKNHLILLEVWRRLVRHMGHRAPHLVIVGSPGWSGAAILQKFERCNETQGYIHAVSGLSSPALTHLLNGSVGLLMPSLNEGFGLPIVEAKRLGVPVIASDIPAHREVAGPEGRLLSADDPTVWFEAVLERATYPQPAVRIDDDRFMTATRYSQTIMAFLDRCAFVRTAPFHATTDAGPLGQTVDQAANGTFTPALE
ncbi:glycosyltransferase family 4 protein [Rhizobium sp. SL86]|uniref:glycosyltransferase family 4 protein n=1 Tax=Rhizobium sp. SL86 TaxID=2995148 RepID=UPI0022767EC0|nr:glycosyltransferase family 1 protein [Rhizobium sp. SL86]MCY1669376.1 glycosyltransferase family 1 protein [Rhizobium sp. SL86]